MIKLSDIGVTKTKESQFAKKNILCAEDLVQYIPRRYDDCTKETPIAAGSSEISCFVMRVVGVYPMSSIKAFKAKGYIKHSGEEISVAFFNQPWRMQQVQSYINRDVWVCGKVVESPQYGLQVTAPECFELNTPEARKIYPVYSKIPGMSDAYLTEKIQAALSTPGAISEPLPYSVISELNLLTQNDALVYLHCPQSQEQIERAAYRLLYNDLIYFAMQTENAKRAAADASPFRFGGKRQKMEALIADLPYELTADQRETIDSILATAQMGRRVNALIQGDVGCGKTIVAMSLMVAAVDSGYQTVVMAPTQVLAHQHYEEICRLIEPLGLNAVFLGSGLKAAERRNVLAAIASGEANIVVGTNAVISQSVDYNKLALVITDEEHRFGVLQRAALVNKAAKGVHCVTMSATPIPRTLAQVVYGDALQLYNIKTMPNGRKPVCTGIATSQEKIYSFIIREAKLGHQAYVVCPLIEQSDSERMSNVKSVEEVFAAYSKALSPYGVRVAALTGRNTKEETDEIIGRFKAGEVDVLVSTTVVEVGVNVPTATLMVISNAERFGLASLHQLRGRVGRSDLQSFCVLDCPDDTDKAMARLDVMCKTNDGFEIAEADLNLRGVGDVVGVRQSGENRYFAMALTHPDEYRKACEIARELLASDKPCGLVQRLYAELEELAG